MFDKFKLDPLAFFDSERTYLECVTAVKNGFDLNARDDIGGFTALMVAAKWCSDERIIELLINAGANIDARNLDGQTSLMMAAMENPATNVLKELLKLGAEVNAIDASKNSALHWAIDSNPNFFEIAMLLVNAGADVNLKNSKGMNSVLQLAHVLFSNGWAEPAEEEAFFKTFELFLSAGATTQIKDCHGKDAFDYISESPLLKNSRIFWLINDFRFG